MRNFAKCATISGLIAMAITLSPASGLAKEKTAANSGPPPDVAWLNGEEVIPLFEGSFWCADPIENSCSFTAVGLGSEGNMVTYDVRFYWDENTILTQRYTASVADDGILCEPTDVNIKTLRAESPDGTALDQQRMGQVRQEFTDAVATSDLKDRCYGYVVLDPEQPYRVTQYEVDIEFNILSTIEFDISYSANAGEGVSLRFP